MTDYHEIMERCYYEWVDDKDKLLRERNIVEPSQTISEWSIFKDCFYSGFAEGVLFEQDNTYRRYQGGHRHLYLISGIVIGILVNSLTILLLRSMFK